MVSIVIVSHSAKLAEGVRELAQQIVQGEVPLVAAGGIDDPDNPIGTDVMKVYRAIESVYTNDGVLVLMDMGSALMSAEMALEFLAPEQVANIFLCEAPLVEGTMAAAVQASIGGDIHRVLAEARGALDAKASQLQSHLGAIVPAPATSLTSPAGDWQDLRLTVANPLGLHARPAARFVGTVNRFEAEITVEKINAPVGKSASAKSINQVATLGIRQGDQILIRASGEDAVQALEALQALADDNFGDSEEDMLDPEVLPLVVAKPLAEGELSGIPASPGIAIGPVVQYRPYLPEMPLRQVDDPAGEWERLKEALNLAMQEIRALHELVMSLVGAAEAAIFEVHQLFLQDPALVDEARTRIFDKSINAEAAWQEVIDETAETYRSLDDAYMQARAADVQDVGLRVLGQLLDVQRPSLDFDQPSILVAADLTPADTAGLNPTQVLGICTELGGATSHSAILARALGIPAIVGLGPVLKTLSTGRMVVMDGGQGRLWPQPTAEQMNLFREKQAQWQVEKLQAKVASQKLAVTQDGCRVDVAANIGSPHDAPIALEFGAEGVGLFRTEFLYLDRQMAPSEEEQFQAYRQVAELMEQRPLIIRTLDVGGDKPLPYLDLGQEANPFLGWRGIRFCLAMPELLKSQLRAILRASYGFNLKVMFPMISTLDELTAAKALLNEARTELLTEGIPYDDKMEVGIMVEVPAAVVVAVILAVEADFFSIGTNDLTQYVMAADRGNARVAELANALQPAVLRMVQQTVRAAHSAGIWVGMCGELAGNPLAAPVLIGLGLDELSMSAPAIPVVKEVTLGLTSERAREITAEVLQLSSAEAVEAYLTSDGL